MSESSRDLATREGDRIMWRDGSGYADSVSAERIARYLRDAIEDGCVEAAAQAAGTLALRQRELLQRPARRGVVT